MNRSEPLMKVVKRRNEKLKRLFAENGINIRLIGDPQKPAMVMDEEILLSAYVKNFYLHFTKEPFSDEIVNTFKLYYQVTTDRNELQQTIDSCEHRKVYKIKLADMEPTLYLVGYNFIDRDNEVGRYPVFGPHKPKVYFKKEFALKRANEISKEGYNLEVV
jgi:hypothetical protein